MWICIQLRLKHIHCIDCRILESISCFIPCLRSLIICSWQELFNKISSPCWLFIVAFNYHSIEAKSFCHSEQIHVVVIFAVDSTILNPLFNHTNCYLFSEFWRIEVSTAAPYLYSSSRRSSSWWSWLSSSACLLVNNSTRNHTKSTNQCSRMSFMCVKHQLK